MEIVAGFKEYGNGLVILIPPNSLSKNHIAHAYVELSHFAEFLTHDRRVDLPDWVGNYQTSVEGSALRRIEANRQKILGIEALITEDRNVVEGCRAMKALFSGTGDAFVAAVSAALQELGLRVVEGPHLRADLIAFDGARLLAIEAKGIDGCAKERHLREAERWLAEVRAALTIAQEQDFTDPDLERYSAKIRELGADSETPGAIFESRGLLVIGAYKSTPLKDRREADFPAPLATVINRSEVCAISGLQLLGLVLGARGDPAEQARVIDLLYSTSGVIAEGRDWAKFLTDADDKAGAERKDVTET
jgi:hypothetical protein